MTLKVIQLNLHKTKTAGFDVGHWMEKHPGTIALIQEPNVNNKTVTKVHFNTQLIYDRNNDNPRAAIVAPRGLGIWEVPNLNSGDVAVGLLKDDKTSLLIISAYLDITAKKGKIIPDNLTQAITFANNNNYQLVIGMDSNSHSTLWGRQTNSRGEELEEYLARHNLDVFNVGRKPTFIGRGTNTCIDITLGNNIKVVNWRVSDQITSSDHLPILFEIADIDSDRIGETLNFDRTDWGRVNSLISANIFNVPDIVDPDWLDSRVSDLGELIEYAIRRFTPIRKINKNGTKKGLMTPELIRLRSQTRQSFRRYFKSQAHEDWHEYISTRAKYKQELRAQKRSFWQKYLNDIPDTKTLASLVKSMKGKETNQVGLMSEGSNLLNPNDTINLLLDTHFPGNAPMDTPAVELHSRAIRWPMDDVAKFVTKPKVKQAIQSFGSKKAAGLDRLKPFILKELDDNAIGYLTTLFKISISLGYVPEAWRKSSVIFIPKPGKDDYGKPKSFRPISLTSFLFKTLEKVVLNQVLATSLVINPVNKDQHAFRSGSSCDSALSDMCDDIESAITRGQYALGIFLDIAGAFDNLDINSAIAGMKRKQIDKNIVNWYSHYLKNRIVHTEVNNTPADRRLTRGTPQGGVLSPVVWNLAFDSLFDIFVNSMVKCRGFADDAALLIKGVDPATLVNMINPVLARVFEWGKANNLDFAPLKTVAVLFHKKKTQPAGLPSIIFNKIQIPISTSVKYLGVTLDRRLSGALHLDNKLSKAKKLLFKLRNSIGKSWGPKPHMMRWAYTGIIRPMVTYGSLVWAKDIKPIDKKLDRLQRLAMLLISSCYRSTPTRGLESIYGLPPLGLFIRYNALNTYASIRDRNCSEWDGIGNGRSRGHLHWWGKLLKNLKLDYERDCCPRFQNWSTPFGILDKNSPPLSDSQDQDGRRNGRRVNIHVKKIIGVLHSVLEVCYGNNQVVTLTTRYHDHVSPGQAEIISLERAVKMYAIWGPEPLVIGCSRAALHALSSNIIKTLSVKNCLSTIGRYSDYCPIYLTDIVGRINVKKIVLSGEADLAGNLPISKTCYKQLCSDSLVTNWNIIWKNLEDNRQTRRFIPKAGLLAGVKLCQHDRDIVSKVIQVLTGHGNFQYYKFKTGESPDQQCQLCRSNRGDSWHMINECTKLSQPWREKDKLLTYTLPMVSVLTDFVQRDHIVGLLQPTGKDQTLPPEVPALPDEA